MKDRDQLPKKLMNSGLITDRYYNNNILVKDSFTIATNFNTLFFFFFYSVNEITQLFTLKGITYRLILLNLFFKQRK